MRVPKHPGKLDVPNTAAAIGGLSLCDATGETGQEKAGEATAGVKRQYMGCAGRVANGTGTCRWCGRRPGTLWPGRGSGFPASTSMTR